MIRVTRKQPDAKSRAEIDRGQHNSRRFRVSVEQRRAEHEQRQGIREQVRIRAVDQWREQYTDQATQPSRINTVFSETDDIYRFDCFYHPQHGYERRRRGERPLHVKRILAWIIQCA